MKTLTIIPILLAIFLLVIVRSAIANDGKYVEAMKKHISSVYNAKSSDEFQAAINSLERIAKVETDKWEPQYYIAFGYVMMANLEQEGAKKDALLDQAFAAVEKGKSIKPDESEIIALEGFVYMLRVAVDPATRGPQYAGHAMEMFGKAIGLNSENPRALALLAQMQYGTAQFFGSPATEACGTLKSALEKFDTYKSENPLSPQWGSGMAEGMKKQCE